MNRLNWALVLVPLAVLGLLVCQNAAFGQDADLPLAPMPGGFEVALAPPVATAPAVPSVTATVPGAACEEGCGCGCCCCDRHWIVDVEGMWLAPIGNQRTATYRVDSGETYSAATGTDATLTMSPRVTLGWQGECWGVQARYWQMDQTNDNHYDPVTGPLTGVVGNNNEGFRAETFDVEVTRLFSVDETQFQWSGGVRYGEFYQTADLNVFQPVTGNYYTGWASSGLHFNGAGLTSSLTAVRPVGSRNFNLFASVRTSVLWDANASVNATARSLYNGTYGTPETDVDVSNASLFIGELEIGGQWNLALKCVPANAFVRASFDYQYWGTSDMDSAYATSTAGTTTHGVAVAGSANGHTNLVGFGITTGLTW
jgi:hypothetical protein